MKTNKNKSTRATHYKESMVAKQSWWWRMMYYAGCFRDENVSWRRQNDGVVKPLKWTLAPRYWHPLMWIAIILYILYAIAKTVFYCLYDLVGFFCQLPRVLKEKITIFY